MNRILPAVSIATLLTLAPLGGAAAQAGPPGRPLFPPAWIAFPGEFALRTLKGYYVTAIDSGGRTTDPVVVTAATSAGPWEKFRLAVMDPPPPPRQEHSDIQRQLPDRR